MKKLVSVLMLGAVVFLSACGGGSGGGSAPAGPVTPVVEQLTCPDGSKVPLASGGVGLCPAVVPLAPVTFANFDPRNGKLIVQFSGDLDRNSITTETFVLRKGNASTGIPVFGPVSLAAQNDRDVTFTPIHFLAYGRQPYNLDVKIKDSVGRPVTLNVQFETADMICTDVATWSTPALFSSELQDCVAPVGVQTQVVPMYNTSKNLACFITAGTQLTSDCKDSMANGTMVLANTGVVVGGHPTVFMFYLDVNASSHIALLDVNDQSNPVMITTFNLPSQLVWAIGNLTGVFVHTSDNKGSQLTVNESSQIVSTCVLGCQ